jgi:hypothetical protein
MLKIEQMTDRLGPSPLRLPYGATDVQCLADNNAQRAPCPVTAYRLRHTGSALYQFNRCAIGAVPEDVIEYLR